MTTPRLILLGAGGHALACIDVIEQLNQYRIAGLVGMPHEIHTQHLGYRVIGTDADLSGLVQEYPCAVVAIGQLGFSEVRTKLYQRASVLGFQFPTIVSPRAYISPHAQIGSGTIVMHGAIVNAGATVGNNCIVNSRSLVEHGATIEDHCHVATGAVINGDARLGKGSFVGSGSSIREGIVVGNGCVIGMGLAVRHDLPDGAVFVGDRKA
jgi:sugar O-acyltransferase (sialic acid O-acetyltransferase NeuD family)